MDFAKFDKVGWAAKYENMSFMERKEFRVLCKELASGDSKLLAFILLKKLNDVSDRYGQEFLQDS